MEFLGQSQLLEFFWISDFTQLTLFMEIVFPKGTDGAVGSSFFTFAELIFLEKEWPLICFELRSPFAMVNFLLCLPLDDF